ncbi:hypothetical protein [Bifidobacterium primatium]|uniref:hypothetical protein n=1 Tax=Bifidobacterium primatium TaxID=2045438 RepID=UPI0013FD9EFB|nr:hypothetical protein [Bifidobacterium primatium]
MDTSQQNHLSSSFTVIATASIVTLAGRLTPDMAMVAYMVVITYAAVSDWLDRR